MKKSRKIVSLLLLLLAIACLTGPGFCQVTTGGSSGASEQKQSPVMQQMTDDFKAYTPNYIGVATARDAFGTESPWEWYWDKKAHINLTRGFFWGEDGISQFFQGVCDNYLVPAWNTVMEPIVVRILVPFVIIGAVSFSIVRRFKRAKKG